MICTHRCLSSKTENNVKQNPKETTFQTYQSNNSNINQLENTVHILINLITCLLNDSVSLSI